MTRKEYDDSKEHYMTRHDGERFYMKVICELLYDLKDILKPETKIEPKKDKKK